MLFTVIRRIQTDPRKWPKNASAESIKSLVGSKFGLPWDSLATLHSLGDMQSLDLFLSLSIPREKIDIEKTILEYLSKEVCHRDVSNEAFRIERALRPCAGSEKRSITGFESSEVGVTTAIFKRLMRGPLFERAKVAQVIIRDCKKEKDSKWMHLAQEGMHKESIDALINGHLQKVVDREYEMVTNRGGAYEKWEEVARSFFVGKENEFVFAPVILLDSCEVLKNAKRGLYSSFTPTMNLCTYVRSPFGVVVAGKRVDLVYDDCYGLSIANMRDAAKDDGVTQPQTEENEDVVMSKTRLLSV